MLAITEANTKRLKSATPAKVKTYKRRKEAQDAAVYDIGPHAREGFEFTSFQCDGRWMWKTTDEVPPPNQAQLKANGGKRSMISLPTAAAVEYAGAELSRRSKMEDGLDIPEFLRRKPGSKSTWDMTAAPKVTPPAVVETIKISEAAPKKAKKAKAEKKPQNKTAMVGKMLLRKNGCTTAEVLAATGWPSVSMPYQAKAVGLSLRKEKDGKVTRYYGTKN